MSTDENTEPTTREMVIKTLRDLGTALCIAVFPAALVGLAMCFYIEATTNLMWEGIWPPSSWGAALLSYIIVAIFAFETPMGRQLSRRIIWKNRWVSSLFGRG
ncbi:hypothetical protein [Hirschia maritima]|uniref:hypothetical protein n=1 Tax=Hirschia maritima TaxID=1121961 RepID=UPI0003697745|nr:hypothetical protein [Hirschia maritima]